MMSRTVGILLTVQACGLSSMPLLKLVCTPL